MLGVHGTGVHWSPRSPWRVSKGFLSRLPQPHLSQPGHPNRSPALTFGHVQEFEQYVPWAEDRAPNIAQNVLWKALRKNASNVCSGALNIAQDVSVGPINCEVLCVRGPAQEGRQYVPWAVERAPNIAQVGSVDNKNCDVLLTYRKWSLRFSTLLQPASVTTFTRNMVTI